MRPVRNKPYQYHTFDLIIPLDLDYDDLVHLSRFNLLGEVLQIASPYSTMGGLYLSISSHIHDHNKDGKLQAYDLF
jgi:hypothetical protein